MRRPVDCPRLAGAAHRTAKPIELADYSAKAAWKIALGMVSSTLFTAGGKISGAKKARPLNKPFVMILCLLALPALALGDGFVVTTGGKRIDGQVVLDRGKLLVKPAGGGDAVVIPISDVKRASFGKSAGKAAAEPKEKPAEPLKPRRVEGLRAEYFADHKMTELKLVRVDR